MEDQTLNPFRAPIAGGQTPRRNRRGSRAPSPARWSRELPICLSLIAIIVIAYCGVWRFDFVFFDDPGYVKDNRAVIRGLPLFKDPKVFVENI